MALTKGEKKVLYRAIAVQCEYCRYQVPIYGFTRENNLYHGGTLSKPNYTSEITMSPCSAYRIRREFDLLGLVSEADV